MEQNDISQCLRLW